MAARIAEEIEGRCGTPDRPEFIDGVDCGNRIAVPEMGTGAVIDVSARNVEDLRRQISNELSLPDAYTCKRVKQIESTLEKIEAFHTERERRRDAAGLHQAEAAYEEAYERACITADAALALEPTSLRDLAMQAEVAMKGGRDGDEGDVLKRLISFAGLDNRADPLARSSLARSPVAC